MSGLFNQLQKIQRSMLEQSVQDDLTSLAENTSQVSSLASKKIYAKDHGVKLDGVTDDTAALNAFFALFGTGVELVVENGVALVTGQLNIPGKWNPSTNDGVRKLTFDNVAINYQGIAGKACVQIYNHQKSIIDGLSILKGSQDTYVNFVGFWYSKFSNFDVPRIRFNYNTGDITATLSTNDSYTNVFERGVTYHGTEFYGNGQTGGGNINSLTFNDVKWQGNGVTPNSQYNLKFYGTSFQNFAFNYCDLSYSTTSIIYIDTTQLSTMRLNFENCYFDTQIPFIQNYDYKGAIVNITNSQMSNSQIFYAKTKNKIGMKSFGNYGIEGDNVITPGLNLAKNGDIGSNSSFSGWSYNTNSPATTFLTNTNTINGNSIQVTFSATGQTFGINGINSPFDGYYTASVRMRVISGMGNIQLGFLGLYMTYDLSQITAGDEILLSNNAGSHLTTQGTSLGCSVSCLTLTTAPLVIEILEVTIVQGTNAAINVPMHPSANLKLALPLAGTVSVSNNGYFVTANRSKIVINQGTSSTGVQLKAGAFDGQELWLINKSASASITFDVPATSLVADGTSDVLNAGTARKYVWDSGSNLWYRTS